MAMPPYITPDQTWAHGAAQRLIARNDAFFARVALRPRFYGGMAAAALVAPLFMKNDERGYFSTSMITTPLVVAGAMAGPSIFQTAKGEASHLKQVFQSLPKSYNFTPGAPYDVVTGHMQDGVRDSFALRQDFEKGLITLEDYLRVWTGEHAKARQAAKRTPEVMAQQLEKDFFSVAEQLQQVWNNQWDLDRAYKPHADDLANPELLPEVRQSIEARLEEVRRGRRRLAQNAIYRSELDVISAADLAAQDTLAVAKDYSWDEAQTLLMKYWDNPEFLHRLQGRLQEAGRVTDPMRGVVAPYTKPPVTAQAAEEAYDLATAGGLGDSLAKQLLPEDLYTEISALSNNAGRLKEGGITGLSIVAIPDRNKAVNAIDSISEALSVRLHYGKHDFFDIYLGNRGGTNFQNEMITRGGVIDLTGKRIRPSLYLAQNAHRGKGWLTDQQSDLVFWANRDPSDGWNHPAGDASARVLERQRAKYRNQYRPSHEFKQLSPTDQVSFIGRMLDSGGFTKISGGNDFSYIEDEADRFMEVFGVVNPNKESLERKSLTTVELAGVDPSRRGFLRSDYLTPTPSAGVVTAQITPNQYGMFRELPAWDTLNANVAAAVDISTLSGDELAHARFNALERMGHNTRILEYIQADLGLAAGQRREAMEVWKSVADKILLDSQSYQAAKSFAYLGDGARILSSTAAGKNAYVREIVHMVVDEPRAAVGAVLGADDAVGFKDGGNAVFGAGMQNVVLKKQQNVNGSHSYWIEQIYGHGIGGAKAQELVKEQIIPNFRHKDVRSMVDVMNTYLNRATDVTGTSQGRIARDVHGFAVHTLHSDKASAPAKILGNNAAYVMREMDSMGQLGRLKPHLDLLADQHLEYANGELVYRSAGRTGGVSEMNTALLNMEQMFADVSDQLINAQFRGNEMMDNAVDWMKSNGSWAWYNAEKKWIHTGEMHEGNLDSFMLRHHLAESIKIADHVNRNIASQVKVTFDTIQEFALMGELDVSKEIVGRLKTRGDTELTGAFMKYADGGDFSSALGKSLSVSEALGSEDVNLWSAGGRANTVFDPGFVGTKTNYSIQLSDKSFVPVLGRDAFGGGVNRYGAGETAANAWEKPLKELLEADRTGNTSPEKLAGLRKAYMDAATAAHGIGKGGFLRAERFDPHGYFGKESVRKSELSYANGLHNPYEVGIGDTFLERFDKQTRARLLKGDHIEALLQRHPVEGVMPVLLKYDKQFNNSRAIGIDPMLALLIGGDADGDNISFHLAHDRVVKNKDVPRILREWAEGKRGVDEGRQGYMYAFSRADEATSVGYIKDLKPEHVPGGPTHPHTMATGAYATTHLKKPPIYAQTPTHTLPSRAGAVATGPLSNTHAQMQTILAHSSSIRNVEDRLLMNHVLYELIRQSPINAAKMQNTAGSKAWDYARLMRWNTQIEKSMQSTDKEAFWKQMLIGAENLKGKDSDYAHCVREYKHMFMGMQEDFSQVRWNFVKHLTMTSEQAQRLIKEGGLKVTEGVGLTMPGLRATSGIGQQMAEDTLSSLNAGWRERAARAVGGAADATLGSLHKVIAAAAGHGAGKTLLAGAGIAAGAGLLFGSLHSPREGQALAPSGNRHRPEERIGTDGHIPGEPETGAMAPSLPPRTMGARPAGVQTAVVAPMHANTNLEVTMRADEPGRAQEMAKRMAQMSTNGHSTVTVNYRDGNRLNSLRTQERIREHLDRN